MRDDTATLYAQVHNRVDELLCYVWDPIGVTGIPETRDEYDAYVPPIVKMLLDGTDALQLADCLEKFATDRMGLSRTPDGMRHSAKVAELLIAHYNFLKRRNIK